MQGMSAEDVLDAVWETHMNPLRPMVARTRIKSISLRYPAPSHIDHSPGAEYFRYFRENGAIQLGTVRLASVDAVGRRRYERIS